MDIRKIEDYYDKLCKEFDNQIGKELSAGSLDTMYKLTSTMHRIDKMIDEDDGDDYSGRRGRSRRGEYGGRYYDGGRSMRRGRDSMGRYTSRGYSGGVDFEEELRELMKDAPDEESREAMRKMLQNLR